MDPTAPLNVTGLPGLTLRFGTSSDGLPIGAQIVAPWMAESTLLHLASLLEAVSPVRGLRPDVSKLSSIVDPPIPSSRIADSKNMARIFSRHACFEARQICECKFRTGLTDSSIEATRRIVGSAYQRETS